MSTASPDTRAHSRTDPSPSPSFWLDETGAGRRRPALEGDREADVCIVGGGFTGLWSAYELLGAAPELEVVLLEAEHTGFGASGRNGGWVLGQVSGARATWRGHGGPDAPAVMARAITATVAEIGRVIEAEAIDCDWQQGGTLTVAQNRAQLERLRAELLAGAEAEREAEGWRLLSAEELGARVAIREGLGALFMPHCARVQPAKLAAGLAAAAERRGTVIHEGSRVLELGPGFARTAAGRVRARTVILATEGYTANLPRRRRELIPLNSAMIVTEPLPDSVWAQIGWSAAETILDGSHRYTYSQRTADGRIAIGGRGVPYRFGSRTDREGPVPPETVRELRERLGSLVAPAAEARIERAWHGVLGVSRDWCPVVRFDAASGLGSAAGYAGEGVAASNLAARTLRDLVLGRDSLLTRLPWVRRAPRRWEPEPVRFIGAHAIHGLYRLADRREAATGRASPLAVLADRIAGR